MDIKSMGFNVGNNNEAGRPKFDPKDLLKLYIYGYFYGIRSSRKLAKQCIINREIIWLLKGVQPKYRVINSADQGQLYNMSKKAKDIFNVNSIEVLADKGYLKIEDFIKCYEENIIFNYFKFRKYEIERIAA